MDLQNELGHLVLQVKLFFGDLFSKVIGPSSQAVADSRLLEAYHLAPAATPPSATRFPLLQSQLTQS